MSLLTEFKQFAMRGNVIDLAVGVVIGGAAKAMLLPIFNMGRVRAVH